MGNNITSFYNHSVAGSCLDLVYIAISNRYQDLQALYRKAMRGSWNLPSSCLHSVLTVEGPRGCGRRSGSLSSMSFNFILAATIERPLALQKRSALYWLSHNLLKVMAAFRAACCASRFPDGPSSISSSSRLSPCA